MGIEIPLGIVGRNSEIRHSGRLGRPNRSAIEEDGMRDQYLNDIRQRLGEQFPDFDHSTVRMIASLTNTYHILLSVMERALTIYGITPQSMDVLIALYVKKGQDCLLGEIGELLMVSPANITGLVQGLVRKGLANRKEHPGDRRKRLVEITPQGIALMEDFIPESTRFFHEVFASVSPQDKLQLYERLRQLSTLLLPYWEKRRMPDFHGPRAQGKKSPGRK
jgi:DNA-binding MarR family transcriptional regulator